MYEPRHLQKIKILFQILFFKFINRLNINHTIVTILAWNI